MEEERLREGRKGEGVGGGGREGCVMAVGGIDAPEHIE